MKLFSDETLAHYGIKNQKWGYNNGKSNGKRKAGESIYSPSEADYDGSFVIEGQNGSKLKGYKPYEEHLKELKDNSLFNKIKRQLSYNIDSSFNLIKKMDKGHKKIDIFLRPVS